MLGYRRHEDIVKLENKLSRLKFVCQELCPHKVVKETGISSVFSFRCRLCDEAFDSKPKGAKISRMKEVLSDK